MALDGETVIDPATGSADDPGLDVAIVGAGMAGLCALYRFREAGLRAVVLEAGDGVGGTWFWNRYPGARCDIESHYYSFSFSPELEQDWTWSEKFAAQPEILRYLEHVADRFDLRRDIRFGTRVDAAHYDEDRARWQLETGTGERLDARFVVMATGCLSVPKAVDVPGVEDFAGRTLHTADWPRAGVDLTGLRVGVIGTGSSGVQSIPLIAEQAATLTVFQRTPVYSMPALNFRVGSEQDQQVKSRYPELRQAARESRFGVPRPMPTRSALEVTPGERRDTFEAAYQDGHLTALALSYVDIQTSTQANDLAAEFMHSKIRETVKDPEVAEALLPTGYPYACKRPCLDTGYYDTYNRENVSLVDLRATPITGVVPGGVETTGGTHELDALVLATGFDAMTGALAAIDIRGRGGRELRSEWRDGPRGYLGLAVAGFPNLFTVTGPGSPSVLSNMAVSIEQHVEWILGAVRAVREGGRASIEATEEAQAAWVAHVAEVADMTLYLSGNSYYIGANVPGKPRVMMAYVGGVGPYRQTCSDVAADGYRGFRMAGV